MKLQPVNVAVGVIKNDQGQVLIAKRVQHVHQGGLWEFPGGKVKKNESNLTTLKRELAEEVGIVIDHPQPLIQLQHHYPSLSVSLTVWKIDHFSGVAQGKEGQQIKWVAIHDLSNYAFPAANKTIITAIQLPVYYAILDDTHNKMLLEQLKTILKHQVTLIQLRIKHSTPLEITHFLSQAIPLCQHHQVDLLMNSATKTLEKIRGLHLTSRDLMALKQRPCVKHWLAASCHNLAQLQHAEKIGVDFVVLAPILPTITHPHAQPLGWKTMGELIQQVNLPVFALGGLTKKDKEQAALHGAQGIAAIRAFSQ